MLQQAFFMSPYIARNELNTNKMAMISWGKFVSSLLSNDSFIYSPIYSLKNPPKQQWIQQLFFQNRTVCKHVPILLSVPLKACAFCTRISMDLRKWMPWVEYILWNGLYYFILNICQYKIQLFACTCNLFVKLGKFLPVIWIDF